MYPQKKPAIPIFFDIEAPQENPLLQETSPWLMYRLYQSSADQAGLPTSYILCPQVSSHHI